jgi:6-phosphogluconolactonase
MMNILIYSDAESLAQAAAAHFVEHAQRAIRLRGRFSVALAGGSTPRRTYALLAGDEGGAGRLDWSRIHFFWGDERCVPPDHPDSNYRMAREELLDRVPTPPANVHRIVGETHRERAADLYEQTLRSFFPSPTTTFDLVWLGLGEDGHTASLFPGSPALEVADRWVAAVEHHSPPAPLVDRITLTLAAINAAEQVTFLVSGAGKAGRLKQVLQEAQASLPAQRVRPTHGDLLWLVDSAAAGDLADK